MIRIFFDKFIVNYVSASLSCVRSRDLCKLAYINREYHVSKFGVFSFVINKVMRNYVF